MEKQEMQNESLLDTATREKLAGRVEVLDKVKELFLLPQLDMMTAQQVADYYEVGLEAIRSCYKDNKTEIDMDGAVFHTKSMIKLKVPAGLLTSELGDRHLTWETG